MDFNCIGLSPMQESALSLAFLDCSGCLSAAIMIYPDFGAQHVKASGQRVARNAGNTD